MPSSFSLGVRSYTTSPLTKSSILQQYKGGIAHITLYQEAFLLLSLATLGSKNFMRLLNIFLFCVSFTCNAGYKAPLQSLFVRQITLAPLLANHIRYMQKQDAHKWSHAALYRETIDFGTTFPALEQGRIVKKPIPNAISKIRNQLFGLFRKRLAPGEQAFDYDNCIVSIYRRGDGIAPHTRS